MSNFVVRTVPVDGPAPLVAGTSAGTVVTSSRFRIYTTQAHEGLTYDAIITQQMCFKDVIIKQWATIIVPSHSEVYANH